MATVSRIPNSKVSGTPIAQANTTISGATKTAICVLEPTEIANERSILSFAATVTAVKCSAALPNSGSSMIPMKRYGRPTSSAAVSRECTRISAIQETSTVAITSRIAASRMDISGSS